MCDRGNEGLIELVENLKLRVKELQELSLKKDTIIQKISLLANIVESSSDAIIGLTVNGTIVTWNKSAERLFGYVSGEAFGHNINRISPVNRQQEMRDILDKILSGKIITYFETEHIRKDGTTFFAALSGSPIFNSTRAIIGMSVVIRDVTERKRIENMLHRSEEKYRSIFEQAMEGMFLSTPEGRPLNVNPAYATMLGYSSPEKLIAEISDIRNQLYATPDDLEKFNELMDKDGQVRMLNAPALKKDKSPLFLCTNARVVKDQDGNTLYEGSLLDITSFKEIEEKLLAERNISDSTINSLPGIFYLFNEDLRYMRWNKNFETVTGYTKDELLNMGPEDLFDGNDKEIIKHAIQECLEKGEANAEAELLLKDKRRIPYFFTGRKIILSRAPKIIGVGIDISGIKKAEQAIRNSEEKYRKLFDLESDAIFLIDNLTGRILEANQAASLLYGYSREEFLEKRNFDLSAEPEMTREAVDNEKNVIPLRYHRKKDGTVFAVEITATHLMWNGRKSHLAAIRDITGRKRAEAALLKSEEDYRSIYDNAMVGIFQSSPEGTYLRANRAFAIIRGFSSSEELISTIMDMDKQHYVDPGQLRKYRELLRKSDTVRGFEVQLYRKDGSKVWISMNVRAIRKPDGTLLFYEGIVEDITTRRHAEEKLKQALKNLRHSEQTLSAAINATNESLVMIDRTGTLLLLNTVAAKRLRKTIPDLIGTCLYDHFPEDVARTRKRYFDRVFETGEAVHFEDKRAENYFELFAYPARNEDGDISRLVIFARDITERKQAEEVILGRLIYENLLSQISSMAVTTKDAQDFLNKSVAIMGKTMFVSRVYIYKYCHETQTMENIHEWTTAGLSRLADTMHTISSESFQWGLELLKNNQTINFADIERIPDDNISNLLYEQDIISILLIPLFVSGEYRGFIGFDNCSMRRLWPEEDVNIIIAISRIITSVIERKEAEEILHESEAKYRSIFENVAEGIFQTTSEGHLLSVNPAMARIHGFSSPAEMMTVITNIGKQLFVNREDSAQYVRIIEEQGFVRNFEALVYCKDNEIIWVSINTRVVRDASGVFRYEGTTTDITDRKKTEAKIRESEERYRSLFFNSIDAVLLTDPDGKILAANPGACRIFGRTEEEICRIGRDGLIDPTDPRLMNALQERELTGQFRGELTFLRNNGNPFPGEISSVLFKDREGKTKTSMIIRDISERKHAEKNFHMLLSVLENKHRELLEAYEELKRSEAMLIQSEKMASLGQLSAGIAHELKNPLGIIVQGIAYVQSSVEDSTLIDACERIKKSAIRADTIIKNLLNFSRQAPLSRNESDLSVLIDETLGMVEHQMNLKNIQVIRNYSYSPNVIVDTNQIKQVFINLFINAVEAMQNGGGTISITTRARLDNGGKKYVEASIMDTGPGIPKEILKNVFDPFFTTKRDSGGTGLGLSVTKGIVDRHKGAIIIESRQGKGTSVTITLPCD